MEKHATSQVRTNLPGELTTFVGRETELVRVRNLLASSRLVTLTGVGGAGKTRLALGVASRLTRAFRDGVWLVELASLDDEELLVQTVVTAVGIRDQSTRWTFSGLAERLADKQLLLILDNCEHLLPACATMTSILLEKCPGLRVITTTRQALRIAGEHIFPVPTLACPHGSEPIDTLTKYEGFALFADRAAATVPDFTVDESNASAISELCRQLDGLPLAIELAAANLRALSPQQIVQRLGDRFDLLDHGRVDVLPHHQTLRALIDWSFDRCTEQEKTLWLRLSVFSETFDLDTAEAVCSGEGLPSQAVLNAIAGLLEKSILIRQERAGVVRYQVLETIRQYGRQALRESKEETTVRQRHLSWYSGLASRMAGAWFGPEQANWFGRMRLEHPNLRTALDFCLTQSSDEIGTGLHIASCLHEYWRANGLMNEARHWVDRLLSHGDATSVVALRAMSMASYFALLQNDVYAAHQMIKRGKDLQQDLHDDSASFLFTVPESYAAMFRGDLPGAVSLLEDFVDRYRGVEELQWFPTALILLALSTSILGKQQATAYWRELLALCDRHNESWRRSYAFWGLGIQHWRQGQAQHARELVRQGLILQHGFDDEFGTAQSIETLAWIAASDQHHKEAARLFGSAHMIRQRMGGTLVSYFVDYHNRHVSLVRDAIGPEAYEKEFSQGGQSTFEQAIGYATGQQTKPTSERQEEHTDPLTRREREIAQLVAQGMSNKKMAETLVISKRTAESHVEHILSKLGFTSRSQITAWVVEHRMLPTNIG
ncbi:LuxR C-terminal-related transcriptional regulator [Saccharopolyspora sp. NPDC000995]